MNRARVVLLALAAALVLALPAAGGGTSTPAVGTAAAEVDLSGVAGAVAYEDGWAVPLRGETPSWYTPALAAQVHAAAGAPVAAPTDAPLPSEVGIRPGSWMISPAGCTMNFIFASGAKLGIGTAGHCVDKTGQSVVLLTVAPGGSNPVLVDIGTVVKRRNNGIGDDFALVDIRPVLHPWVSPTMAIVAGPCGAYGGSGPERFGTMGTGLRSGPAARHAQAWR